MADNTTLNAGSGGDTYASDDIGGVKFQRVKLVEGADGSNDGDISSSNPLPVDVSDDATRDLGVATVDNGGTFAVQESGDALTALQLLDDVVYVDDADWTDSTSKHTLVGGLYQSTPQTITDGDVGPIQVDSNGNVKVAGVGTFTVDGSGVTQPVSGTVTANLGATDNAVLDQIEVNTSYGDNTGTGTESGCLRVTIATDSTGVLSVDDNAGSLTVDNGGTFVVQEDGAALTALQLIDDSIFADDAAFTTGSSKVTMAGAIRDDSLSTLTAVEGDAVPLRVSATGALHVTGGGGGTEYTEDAAAASDPVGGATILVRADTPATVTSTDGDNVAQRGTNYGAAYCQIVDSSGNFVDSFGGSGGTAAADDADFTAGTTQGTPSMGVYESSPTSVTDGDLGTVGITSTRALRVSVDAALPAGTNAIGKLAPNSGVDIGDVDVISCALPTGAATAANQSTGNTSLSNIETAAQLIDNASVAHDAAVVSGVTQIGLAARSTAGTAVGDGDAVRALATLLGKQITVPYAIPGLTWQYAAASGGITNTTGVTAKAAAGAGIRNYVTRAQVINGHATVSTDVQIRDGASGTVLWRGFAQAAGGGVTAVFDPPLRGTANTLIEVACGTTGTATYFNLQGYTAAE